MYFILSILLLLNSPKPQRFLVHCINIWKVKRRWKRDGKHWKYSLNVGWQKKWINKIKQTTKEIFENHKQLFVVMIITELFRNCWIQIYINTCISYPTAPHAYHVHVQCTYVNVDVWVCVCNRSKHFEKLHFHVKKITVNFPAALQLLVPFKC